MRAKCMTKKALSLFHAELILLIGKHFQPPESGYDIKNILEDYCHDSEFSKFMVRPNGYDYVKLDMTEEAKRVLLKAANNT